VDDAWFIPENTTDVLPRLLKVSRKAAIPEKCEVRVSVRNMSLESAQARLGIEMPAHLHADAIEQSRAARPRLDRIRQGEWQVRGGRKPGDRIDVKWLDTEELRQWVRAVQLELRISLHPVFSRGLLGRMRR
jgi:hypothetical protein